MDGNRTGKEALLAQACPESGVLLQEQQSHVVQFIRGAKSGTPVIVASAPFGLLFGVVAVDNGFNVWESVLMSAMVFAGASQPVSCSSRRWAAYSSASACSMRSNNSSFA